MLEKLYRWVVGYYYIRISNNVNRYIDVLSKNDIPIWDVVNRDGNIYFKVSKQKYSCIDKYGTKTETNVEIIDKRGLFVWITKSKKRLVFIIGFVILVFLVNRYNNYLWDIEIVCDEDYPSETIKNYIINNCAPIGTLKNDVDCSKIEDNLRKQYPNISWISCDIRGTTLKVNFSETIEAKLIEKNESPRNIVSSRDCIVSDIVVKSGCLVCEKGQEVKKGDILITGVVNLYNEYEELEDTTYVSADGEIYGIYDLNYKESFDLKYTKKERVGQKKHRYYIKIFDKIFLKPKKNLDGYTEIERKIKIGKSYNLPLCVYELDTSEYQLVNCQYDDKQANEKAMKMLDLYIDNLRKKGVEILQNNVKIYLDNDKCVIEGTIKVKALIGVPSNLEIIGE